jgi:hypothetical protein
MDGGSAAQSHAFARPRGAFSHVTMARVAYSDSRQ